MKTTSETKTVKAVGFAVIPPEVIVIHYKYGRTEKLHVFPPLPDVEEEMNLTDGKRKHVVLLRDASKLTALFDLQPSPNIHRLLVFGNPEDLDRIGVPIIDAEVRDGKVVEPLRQYPEVLNKRILDESVDLDLIPTKKESTPQKAKNPASKKSPKRRLAWWLDKVLADVDEKYHEKIRAVTFKRIVDRIGQTEFKRACKRLITKLGVKKPTAVKFYRWVEGTDGDGIDLGRAVSFYYGATEDKTVDEIADEYDVDADDVRMVIAAVEDFEDDE